MLAEECQTEELKDQVQKQENHYAPSYNQRVGYQLTYNKNRFLVVGQKEPEDLPTESNEEEGVIRDGERKSIDCTVDNRSL